MRNELRAERLNSWLRLLGFLLLAVASAYSAGAQQDQAAQNVSFCLLSKTPADFAGQRIRIRGVFRFALEEEVLEQPECCLGKKLKNIRISINGNPMYPDKQSQRLTHELFKRSSGVALVVFVGTFDGRLLKVDRVERVERLVRPIDIDHDPAWVPNNCPRDGESANETISTTLNYESGHIDPPKPQGAYDETN